MAKRKKISKESYFGTTLPSTTHERLRRFSETSGLKIKFVVNEALILYMNDRHFTVRESSDGSRIN